MRCGKSAAIGKRVDKPPGLRYDGRTRLQKGEGQPKRNKTIVLLRVQAVQQGHTKALFFLDLLNATK
jgi:hypothetical protein